MIYSSSVTVKYLACYNASKDMIPVIAWWSIYSLIQILKKTTILVKQCVMNKSMLHFKKKKIK